MDRRVRREVARRFRAQAGVASRHQLRAIGVPRHEVDTAVRRGEWERVGRSVVRATAVRPGPEQALWLALLGGGPSAVASHRSAAWWWGLVDAPERHSVIVARNASAWAAGATVHRPRDYPVQVVTWNGLPCTDPLRTVVDLAAVAPTAEVTGAVDRVLAAGLVTVPGIEAEVERLARPGRPGVQRLRAVLGDLGVTGAPTASVLERHLLRLLTAAGIGPVVTESREGPDGRYRVDARVEGTPVAVEVDGWAYHASPEAKAEDERRRNRLRLSGLFVLVYTWRDVVRDGRRVVSEVRAALEPPRQGAASRRPAPPPRRAATAGR